MTNEEIKDAAWSARLLVEGRVISISDATQLAIAEALLVCAPAPRIKHRLFTLGDETIVKKAWVEDWTRMLSGLSCRCLVTSCEHEAVLRASQRKLFTDGIKVTP